MALAAAIFLTAPTLGHAQSGTFNIHTELKRTQDACISYIERGDDKAFHDLAAHGYRVTSNKRWVQALQKAAPLPGRRLKQQISVSNQFKTFGATATCQIYVSGVPQFIDRVLIDQSFAALIADGYAFHGQGLKFTRFTKGDINLRVRLIWNGGAYTYDINRMQKF